MRKIRKDEIGKVSRLFTDIFAEYEAYRLFFPDEKKLAKGMEAFFRYEIFASPRTSSPPRRSSAPEIRTTIRVCFSFPPSIRSLSSPLSVPTPANSQRNICALRRRYPQNITTLRGTLTSKISAWRCRREVRADCDS